jgi:hypothetical protein
MILDLHNEQDTEHQEFTGKKPTFWEGSTNLKWMGQKAMEHAAGGARAAAMVGSIIFPKEDVPRAQDPGRIVPREEDFYRFIENYVDPAEKYWTPPPDEVGTAGKILGGVTGMALAGGPGNITLNATMNTGANLIDQGVDPTTATVAGIGTGAVNYAMTGVPQTGKTLLGKAGLVLLNPLMGIAQDLALKKGLESQGYKEQAAGIDPYDPVARGTDVFIGALFGGLAHFAEAKGQLPVEVVDAVDTLHNHEKVKAASPFKEDAGPVLENIHVEAYSKALNDLHDGLPVDVSQVIKKSMSGRDTSGRDIEADAMKARNEINAVIDGKDVSDVELNALVERATGTHPQIKTEVPPEVARIRGLAEKETTALAEELAREFPEYTRRIITPHQDVAPWNMTREELFSARDTTRQWYDDLERSILGDQVKEWQRAVSRGDTKTTDLIESRLKPEEVDALYGVGTKYAPEDFAHLADARDTVRAGLELNGYTEKNLAGEIASSLYKIGKENDPNNMTPSEREAYVKLDEAFKIIQERGLDSKVVSDGALKLAVGHFPDPEDALFMLNRFVNREQQSARPDAADPSTQLFIEGAKADRTAAAPEDQGTTTHAPQIEEQTSATHPKVAEEPPTAHGEHEALATDVETLLREHGDVSLVHSDADGQRITVSARQVLEEARADVERTRQLEKAYIRAALCLGLD